MRATPQHAASLPKAQLTLIRQLQTALTTNATLATALQAAATTVQATLADVLGPETPVQVGCAYADEVDAGGTAWRVRPLTTCAGGLTTVHVLTDPPTPSALQALDGVATAWTAPLRAAAAPPALLTVLAPVAPEATEAAEEALQATQHLLDTSAQTLAAGLRGWTPSTVWDEPEEPDEPETSALPVSQATLEAVIRHLPGYIIITDADRMIRYISRTLDGRDPALLLGRHVLSFSEPALHPAINEAYDQAERTLKSSLYSVPYTLPDDETVHVIHCEVRPIVDADRVVGFALHSYDASLEMAQKLERSQLHALVENAQDFIGLGTLDGQITYINPAGLAMVGLPSIEAARQTKASDYILPEDREEYQATIMPSLMEKGYWRGMYRFRHFATDTPIPCDIHSFFVRDDDGRAVALAMIARDMTEQQQIQATLKEERQRLAIAIAGAELGTWVADMTTGACTFNERWAEMLGYALEEVEPTLDFFKSLTHPDDRQRVFEQLNEQARGERDLMDLEIRMRHKDGTWRGILNRGKTVEHLPDGSPKRVAGTHLDITERKVMEDALRTSQQRFELATRSTNDGIWEYDFATNQLYWSPRMYRLFGYEPGSFEPSLDMGREFMHPDDLSKHEESFTAHIEQGKVYGFEYRHQVKDGSYRWFFTTGTCHFDDEGQPVRMAGSVSDIHDRKQAELALRESEELYRLLADHATDVITIMEAPDLNFTYVSPSVQHLLGYTPEEYCLFTLSDVLTPDSTTLVDARKVERITDPRTKAGVDFPIITILEHIHKDGHYLITENVSIPFRDADDEIQGYIVNTRDITARKMTEEALQESEARFRVAFEAAPIGIALLDDNGQLVRVNPAMTDLLGRSEAELFNTTYLSLLVDDDRPLWKMQLDRLRDGSHPVVQIEQRLRHRDGYPQWVLARATQTQGPSIKAAYFVVQVLDISAQKSYELGLIEAKNRAEEANRLKDTFLANMSHEIRTPLTSILGFTSLLEMQVPDELRPHTTMIQRSGKRLMETLTSMLELAQMQAQSLQLHPTRLDLGAQARTAADLLSVQAKTKGIDLDVDVPAEPVLVNADENALQRVLANLVSNGIKFTQAGHVRVTVEAADYYATIRVRDTGIGISQAFLPYVFDAFKQESNGMGRAYEGTGLGLTISRELVTLMGGTIHVDSVPREGTTFTLNLPLAPSETPSAALSSTAPPAAAKTPPTSLRPMVLVVEDMVDAAIVAERFLRDYYTVRVAHTWDDAMGALDATAFDVFVIDINLKAERDGLELMHALRAQGYTDTPMIACTAYALPTDKQRLTAAGFNLHLSKPYTQDQLLQSLARVLGYSDTDAR